MPTRLFDRKFGPDLLTSLPQTPAVYLFRDEEQVLYVGKAKNVRRRLSSYRNASRKKVHRKMRRLVREATSLEVRPMESEAAALLTENELIQELRPPFNVDGAYSFLYPAIGILPEPSRAVLCFTTSHEEFTDHDFTWFGSYRSRWRAKAAFDTWIELLGRVGHIEPRARMEGYPRVRGSRVVGVRRLPERQVDDLFQFLDGASLDPIRRLSVRLLEKPRAVRDAAEVQAGLSRLAAFHERDLASLRTAHDRTGRPFGFLPQEERDPLFIRARMEEPFEEGDDPEE